MDYLRLIPLDELFKTLSIEDITNLCLSSDVDVWKYLLSRDHPQIIGDIDYRMKYLELGDKRLERDITDFIFEVQQKPSVRMSTHLPKIFGNRKLYHENKPKISLVASIATCLLDVMAPRLRRDRKGYYWEYATYHDDPYDTIYLRVLRGLNHWREGWFMLTDISYHSRNGKYMTVWRKGDFGPYIHVDLLKLWYKYLTGKEFGDTLIGKDFMIINRENYHIFKYGMGLDLPPFVINT